MKLIRLNPRLVRSALLCIQALLATSLWATPKDFRLVWAQDHGNQQDVFVKGKQIKLMGFDSRTGKEQAIHPSLNCYSKPLLSSDGQTVVYSDRIKNKVFTLPFSSTGKPVEPTFLCEGYAADTWLDPETKIDYAIVASKPGPGNNLPSWGELHRVPIHAGQGGGAKQNAAKSSLVWNGHPTMINNFQLSRDGKLASGQFPWPKGGVANLETQRWYFMDRGCWSSMMPDNSYVMWMFDGLHRNLYLQNAITREKWMINIHQAPGIDGFEAYHPRWSNHPSYFCFTGPFREGPGANKIKAGGKAIEIYLGTFSADFKRMESVKKITSNPYADFFPDLWVAGGETVDSPFPQQDGLTTQSGGDLDLFYEWKNAATDNKASDGVTPFNLFPYDKAYIGNRHELVMRGKGGHGNPKLETRTFYNRVAQSGAFTVEALFVSAEANQQGPARMMSFTAGKGRENVMIGQKGNRAIVKLRTTDHPAGAEFPLGDLVPGEPFHVILSYQPEELQVRVNGVEFYVPEFKGRPSWSLGPVLFGEELGYGFPWKGSVSHIRLLSRALRHEEFKPRYEAAKTDWENRPRVQTARVRAKLTELSSFGTVEQLGAYRSTLNAGAYELVEVLSGTFSDKRFAGYGFGILNKKVNPDRHDKIGTVYEFELQPFNQQPQFQGELKSNDLEDIDLVEYFVLP